MLVTAGGKAAAWAGGTHFLMTVTKVPAEVLGTKVVEAAQVHKEAAEVLGTKIEAAADVLGSKVSAGLIVAGVSVGAGLGLIAMGMRRVK